MAWMEQSWTVEQWLKDAGMDKYTTKFLDNGYDTQDLCAELQDQDLDAIGIAKRDHRKRLFALSKQLREDGWEPKVTLGSGVAPSLVSLPSKTSTGPIVDTIPGGYSEVWAPPPPSHKHAHKRKDKGAGASLARPNGKPAATSRPGLGKGDGAKSKQNGAVPVRGEEGDEHDGSGVGKKVAAVAGAAKAKHVHHSKSQAPSPLHVAPPPSAASLPPIAMGARQKSPAPTSPPPAPVPAEPASLPPYQRDDGMVPTHLTKLQLKLKIRDELQMKRVILTEPPYTQDGVPMGEKLEELAETFGGQFNVEPLEVYDALQQLWKVAKNQGQFATPIASQPSMDTEAVKTPSAVKPPTPNYDEPFDIQPRSRPSKAGAAPVSRKSFTLPAGGMPLDGNYDEPFDSVSLAVSPLPPPQQTKGSPPSLPPRNKQQFATMPIDSSPESLRHRSRDEDSRRSSPKPGAGGGGGFMKLFRSKVSKSRDDTSKSASALPSDRQKKKPHGYRSSEHLDDDFPVCPVNPPDSSSESDASPHPSKQSHFRRKVSVQSDQEDEPRSLWATHSTDDLHDLPDLDVHKKGQKGGIMSRLFKRRTTKKSKKMSTPGMRVSELAGERSGLTASVSMPDIALLKASPGHSSLLKPPKPLRSHLHNSPPHSPETSPLATRRVMIHSSTESRGDDTTIPVLSGSAPSRGSPDPRIASRDDSNVQSHSSTSLDHNPQDHQYGNLPGYQFGNLPGSLPSSEDTGSQFSGFDLEPHSPPGPSRLSSLSSRDSRLTQDDEAPPPVTPPPSQSPGPPSSGPMSPRHSSPPVSRIASVLERVPSAPTSMPRKPLPPPKPKRTSVTLGPGLSLSKTASEGKATSLSPSGSPVVTSDPSFRPPKPARSIKGRSARFETGDRNGDVFRSTPNLDSSTEPVGTGQTSSLVAMAAAGSENSVLAPEKPRTEAGGGGRGPVGRHDGAKPRPSPKPRLPAAKPTPLARPRPTPPFVTPAPTTSTAATPTLATPTFVTSPVPTLATPTATTPTHPAPPPTAPTSATPTQSVLPPVGSEVLAHKLEEDSIDLVQEPYSSKLGRWGVPYPLVSRYADELHADKDAVAMAMEELREKKLKKLSRLYIPADRAEMLKVSSPMRGSVDDYLISIGLPMYTEGFRQRGLRTVDSLLKMKDYDLSLLKLKPSHRKILISNLRSRKVRPGGRS